MSTVRGLEDFLPIFLSEKKSCQHQTKNTSGNAYVQDTLWLLFLNSLCVCVQILPPFLSPTLSFSSKRQSIGEEREVLKTVKKKIGSMIKEVGQGVNKWDQAKQRERLRPKKRNSKEKIENPGVFTGLSLLVKSNFVFNLKVNHRIEDKIS